MNFHQVFDPVKNAPDVFGIETARHFFDRTINDQIDVELGTDLPNGACQSDSVVFWLERSARLRQMLLEIGAQQRRVELRFEAEVVFNHHRLHIRIHHDRKNAFFKTRHRDRFVDERVFRPAQLPKFNTSLAHLFGTGIIADNQHLKVRFGQIAGVEVVLQQTILFFHLAFFAQLPCIRGTPIGTGDDRLGDPIGDS